MVLVAVAGGTSPTLGRAIVTAILATNKHEVVILSRKPENDNPSLPTHIYGARIAYVSYDSIRSLSAELEGCQVVLSCLKIIDPALEISYHTNLLKASVAVGTVQRFSPADYSLGPITHKTVLAGKSAVLKACQSVAAELSSNIEIAQFQNGAFLQYLAQKLPDPHELYAPGITRSEKLLCGLEDDLMFDYINIALGKLFIPTTNSGTPAQITMTSIADVGNFVAAAISLPPGSWNGDMGMVGCTMTFAEIRDILVKETNAPPIKVDYITAQKCDEIANGFDAELEKGFSLEAFKGKMVAQMEKALCGGLVDEGVIKPELNKLCPDVEVTDLKTYLVEVWGKRKTA